MVSGSELCTIAFNGEGMAGTLWAAGTAQPQPGTYTYGHHSCTFGGRQKSPATITVTMPELADFK